MRRTSLIVVVLFRRRSWWSSWRSFAVIISDDDVFSFTTCGRGSSAVNDSCSFVTQNWRRLNRARSASDRFAYVIAPPEPEQP